MNIKRRQAIWEMLKRKGTLTLKELEEVFPDISSMTLRRDFQYFESIGEAIRVKGGIRYIRSMGGVVQEDVYEMRLLMNQAKKDTVARIAAEYIETGRSIFFDSGTTALNLARIIPDKHLSILTSSPNIALEILKRHTPSVNLIGGAVNRDNLSVSGEQSLKFIKDYNFDVAFMVPSAFSCENGFSIGNYSESELKRHIVRKSKKTIAMVDSSKFEKSMPFTFATLEQISVLITDMKPSNDVLDAAKKQGVLVRWE